MRRKNKDMNSETSILTADEVAEYLKLSKITVYKLAKQGQYRAFELVDPGDLINRLSKK